MNEAKVQKVIERLELLRKKSERYSNLTLFLMLATIISPLFLCPDTGKCLMAYGIGIVAAIMAAAKSSKYYNFYRQFYKNVFVKEMLKEKFENIQYEWKHGFTGPELYNSKLLKFDGHLTEDCLKASYQGVVFEQVDVRHFTSHGKYARIDFRGKIMKFRAFPVSTSGVWIYTKNVKSTARYYEKARKWVMVNDNEFSKIFDVYACKEADVERILTSQFKEKLLALSEKCEAFGMSFHGSILHVGIHTPRDTFDVDVNIKKVDYDEEVMKVRKDVEDMAELIELLEK